MKLRIIVDRELLPLNPAQTVLKEAFEHYKTTSLNLDPSKNFITPPIGVQMQKPSVHPSFGRDTEFERPESLINDIYRYNLTKVHVDTRHAWQPHKEQWYCTSNESIVYSGFETTDGTYVIVIIEFLISVMADSPDEFDAHKSYTADDVDNFLDIAAENEEDYEPDSATD